MRTMQLALPPKFGFSIVVLALAIWTLQHPSSAAAASVAPEASARTGWLEQTNWHLPISTPAELVNNYQAPSTTYGAGHRGIDYSVVDGQSVYAPNDGEVTFAGLVAEKPVISIKHAGDFLSSFEPVCHTVLVGQRVKRGDLIGRACGSISYRSHCAPRLCLHYGIRNAGFYLSPLGVAGALPPSHTVTMS